MPATLSDIARQADVAPSTVADILRGRPGYAPATCRRVIEIARSLNYVQNYFARSLQSKCSHTIGIAGRLAVTGFSAPTFQAIVEGLRAKNYMPLFHESSTPLEGETTVLRELCARRVDGVIMQAESSDKDIPAMAPPDIPLVLIRCLKVPGIPCVEADRAQAFANGVQWLAERGHRRIAFMGVGNAGAMQVPLNTHRHKILGYRAAMSRLGLLDEALMLDCTSPPGGVRTFVTQQARLFQEITAVLACNDRVAIEVMSGLTELGRRVPEDCSVIGFDNTEFAMAVRPQLTSFNPLRAEVGAKAVEMILSLIEGQPVENVTFVPILVERESAGPCRK